MRPAFAEEATIFGVENGKLSGGAITGLFQGIDAAFIPSPEGRAVIAYINVTGTAANARLDNQRRLWLVLHRLTSIF